jgi:hypothetical protein
MRKFIIILLLLSIVFSSCKEKKVEFIESKAIKGLVLVKNLPKSPYETKKLIIEYVKNQKEKDFLEFYEYSSNTKAFVENERTGGYFREYIHHYQDENGICVFYIGEYKEDTLKQVGVIRYYGKYGDFYIPDTIYKKYDYENK